MLKIDSAYKLGTNEERNMVVFSIDDYYYALVNGEEIYELPKSLVVSLAKAKVLLPTAGFTTLSEEEFVEKTHRTSTETPPYTNLFRYDIDTEMVASGGNLYYIKTSVKEQDGFQYFAHDGLVLSLDIKDQKINGYQTYEEEGEGTKRTKELPVVFIERKEGVFPMERGAAK